MRDYWLTQDLLKAAGFGYLAIALIALLLALWIPKRWWAKVIAAAIVLGLVSILPIQGIQEIAEQRVTADEFKQRYNKARDLFDKRCESAGEKIYKTVENVEGVIWMKWRPGGLNREQFTLDDPYGKDCSMEGCILRLLRGTEVNSAGTESSGKRAPGYKFVETIDPADGNRYRYTGVMTSVKDVPKEVFMQHVKNTGYGSEGSGQFLALKRESINEFTANFGVIWDDVSTRIEREYWIAGGSLKIIDIKKNEIVAERLGYLMDTGQGSTAGDRDPWGWARSYAPRCPQKIESAADFALRVIYPIK